MLKQYWVQGVKDSKMVVVLKTESLTKAISKLNTTSKLFIWDCLSRNMVKANYNCTII